MFCFEGYKAEACITDLNCSPPCGTRENSFLSFICHTYSHLNKATAVDSCKQRCILLTNFVILVKVTDKEFFFVQALNKYKAIRKRFKHVSAGSFILLCCEYEVAWRKLNWTVNYLLFATGWKHSQLLQNDKGHCKF